MIVGLEWTVVRSFHTLMAAACLGGRAVPLLWASYAGSSLRRSQGAPRERLLREFAAPVPGEFRLIILADRGFGRAEWAAACRELKLHYVVRIRPDTTIRRHRHRGVLKACLESYRSSFLTIRRAIRCTIASLMNASLLAMVPS